MVRTVFLEPLERLDGLVVGEADPGFAAGEPVDFIGEGKLAAEFERAGEGIVFEARDAEKAPPVMSGPTPWRGTQPRRSRLGGVEALPARAFRNVS